MLMVIVMVMLLMLLLLIMIRIYERGIGLDSVVEDDGDRGVIS